MIRFRAVLVACVLLAGCAGLRRAAPETHYRSKCSSCHDAGMAHAPRIGSPEDWAERLARGRAAIYATALAGKPDTAMLAKGGYTELSDAEVVAIVDYMLSKLPAAAAHGAVPAAAREDRRPAASPAVSDDEVLVAVQAAYRAEPKLPATAIKIRVAAGVVTLEGVVDRADQVRLAEEVAARVHGVRRVQSKLISSALFEWD